MQYDCYVTMETHKFIVMQQYHHVTIATHCYTTGTITSLWKCHQGLIYHNTLSFDTEVTRGLVTVRFAYNTIEHGALGRGTV
jgi:hypothetical protein